MDNWTDKLKKRLGAIPDEEFSWPKRGTRDSEHVVWVPKEITAEEWMWFVAEAKRIFA
jgi:hypothetical protein